MMRIPNVHILSQRRVIGALARTVAVGALRKSPGQPVVPGKKHSARIAAPPAALVRDFVRLVGGDPSAYKKHLPPHFFPHWTFPSILRALADVPYPPSRIVNAGCSLEIAGELAQGEPLDVVTQLKQIDDNGRRALITVRVLTGTNSAPEALRADFRALVPLGDKKEKKGASAKPRISDEARELAVFHFSEKAGLDFAKVTGDFNPIHWVPSYARAMGFKNVILHGFGSMSWSIEGLNRSLFAGNVRRIRTFDAQFARPLVLPGRAGLYVWGDHEVGLGTAPGGPAYMLGRFRTF